MRIIYGTKVLIEKDLFEDCSRPKKLIQLVTDNLKDTLNDLDDACLFFMHRGTYQSAQFNFRFIPLQVIEQYILFRSIKDNTSELNKNMITGSSKEDSNRMIEIAKENLQSLIMEYTELELRKIEYETCMTFIFDKEDKLKDICLSIPDKVISKIGEPIIYECSDCGKITKTDTLPEDMYYEVHNNKVFYYCDNCIPSHKGAVHVGDIYEGGE